MSSNCIYPKLIQHKLDISLYYPTQCIHQIQNPTDYINQHSKKICNCIKYSQTEVYNTCLTYKFKSEKLICDNNITNLYKYVKDLIEKNIVLSNFQITSGLYTLINNEKKIANEYFFGYQAAPYNWVFYHWFLTIVRSLKENKDIHVLRTRLPNNSASAESNAVHDMKGLFNYINNTLVQMENEPDKKIISETEYEALTPEKKNWYNKNWKTNQYFNYYSDEGNGKLDTFRFIQEHMGSLNISITGGAETDAESTLVYFKKAKSMTNYAIPLIKNLINQLINENFLDKNRKDRYYIRKIMEIYTKNYDSSCISKCEKEKLNIDNTKDCIKECSLNYESIKNEKDFENILNTKLQDDLHNVQATLLQYCFKKTFIDKVTYLSTPFGYPLPIKPSEYLNFLQTNQIQAIRNLLIILPDPAKDEYNGQYKIDPLNTWKQITDHKINEGNIAFVQLRVCPLLEYDSWDNGNVLINEMSSNGFDISYKISPLLTFLNDHFTKNVKPNTENSSLEEMNTCSIM